MQTGDAAKMTIYVGEGDRHGRKPLYRAIVEMLHSEGISGATVSRGIEGYGGRKQIHTARVLDLSTDLPMIIRVIDSFERIEAVLPLLDEMIDQGVVTTEKVNVVIARPETT